LNQHRVLRTAAPERQRLSLEQVLRTAKTMWHGVRLGQADWSDSSHSLAFSAEDPYEKLCIHVILNAYWEPLNFELSSAANGRGAWRRWIDTSLDSPDDIVEWHVAPPIPGGEYLAGPRSVVVLYADAAAASL